MKKILLIVLTIGILGGGSAIVAAQVSGDDAAEPSVTQPPRGSEDISGPCDEAEHANDPRCMLGGDDRDDRDDRGRDHTEDDGIADDRDDLGEDISGPCDEAEHAGDPECAGVAASGMPADDDAFDDHGGDDDSSGPGSGDDDRYDDHGDDDSSGHGSDDD